MATIRHKRSTTAGATPAANALETGELAVNVADGKVFTKKADDTVVAMAQDGDVVKLTGTQSVAGEKTFSDITTVSNTTASTSTTTGALRVAGGVGVGGAVNVGGGMTVTPNANAPTSNIAIGPSAGAAMTTTTDDSIAIGRNAFLLGFGDFNVCIGSLSGDALTSGVENTAVGYNALSTAQSSGSNSAFGANALANNLTGGSNTAIGANAMLSNQSGSSNVAIGVEAFQSNTSGGTNCAIGRAAGRYRGSGTSTLTSATSSVFIGYQSRAADNAQTNQVVIAGTDGLGDGSNTTVIGNTSTTSTRFAGTATSVLRTSGDTLRIDNARTPATAGAAGNAGDICWDANYIYVCVAANTWKRVAIATWP